jgi:hypothetical protein
VVGVREVGMIRSRRCPIPSASSCPQAHSIVDKLHYSVVLFQIAVVFDVATVPVIGTALFI